jgi:hypothetical protein
MTTYYGDNYTKAFVDKPSTQISSGDAGGRKRHIFDSKLLDVAVLNTEKIYIGKLPKGARVTNAFVRIDKSLGATGIFDLGHGASASGAISANSDAFVVAADAGGQAVLKGPTLTEIGIGVRFDEEVDVYLTCTENQGVVVTGTIYAEVEYVTD